MPVVLRAGEETWYPRRRLLIFGGSGLPEMPARVKRRLKG